MRPSSSRSFLFFLHGLRVIVSLCFMRLVMPSSGVAAFLFQCHFPRRIINRLEKHPATLQQSSPRGPSKCTTSCVFMSTTTSSQEVIPRAAVSVVVRCNYDDATNNNKKNESRYVLVQRGREPNKGLWSLPGGKIVAGETTLEAARRELQEETQLFDGLLKWHEQGPFRSTDSIHKLDSGQVLYHYVISQCFCTTIDNNDAPPTLYPSDDAANAEWWTLDQVQQETNKGHVTEGVVDVLKHAERLYSRGMLPCT